MLPRKASCANPRGFVMAGYPLGPVVHFEYIDNWRNSDGFGGLEIGTG